MPKVTAELFSRPPWGRMMAIHEELKAERFPNCTALGKKLEVCIRTIKRDVDFMKYRLDLPIEYNELKYGYYYSKPVDKFPSVAMTEQELFALLVAHKAIAQYQGTQFQRPLETAFAKLVGQLDDRSSYSVGNLDQAVSFRPFAPEDMDARKFHVLSQAVQQQRELKFEYRNLGATQVLKRHVQPYHLACIDSHWYLFAFDLGRKAIRTYVLTRLNEPEMLKGKFSRPKDFNPDDYLKGSFTVFKGADDYEVVVEFDAWASDLIRGRRWHSSQELTELPGGLSRLRMRLNNLEEIERWILSWGTHATVIRPAALIERMRAAAAGVAGKYEKLKC